jgi:ABC-type dipeptide/oligopeptide/nickel transport system ATPase component
MMTDDIPVALIMADYIAVMQEGELLPSEAPQQILAHPFHPHLTALLETPRKQGARLESLVQTPKS